ncbi:cell wall-binding repeat-containing protein [Herbiconiux sp. P16]|uniref:cell wall-binding repeat-containing protein n=1 Tax=Herbiconiux wuyangfengii TaxID=3342794 RepID=UPI0035BB74F4
MAANAAGPASIENVAAVGICYLPAVDNEPALQYDMDVVVPQGAIAKVIVKAEPFTLISRFFDTSQHIHGVATVPLGDYTVNVFVDEVLTSTTNVSIDESLCATPKAVVDRVAGADRFEVAVNISKLAYPGTADIVFVATGGNYPDALSAGPAAAHLGGPLLLTATESLVPNVANEIKRLNPKEIVVVGGVNSISNGTFDQLKTLQTNIVRIGGADRYEASRNLVTFSFGKTGASTAYVATGANFPDALSAGAAAATMSGPVLLVNGGSLALDPSTKNTLTSLGVKNIVVAGGPNSVSPTLENDLAKIGWVVRDGGTDRFAASVAINQRAFPTASRAFLATGLNFPDALAGSAWAGLIGAPLYVTNRDCVPSTTLAAMAAQGVTRITLLGGPATLTPAVETLRPCS